MKEFLGCLLIFLALSACTSAPPSDVQASGLNAFIPDVQIAQDSILKKEGIAYYQGAPFSGTVLEYHSNDSLRSRSEYFKGKLHGYTRKWYPDGKQQELRYYIEGYKESIHVTWWQNGNLRTVYNFQNDLHHGNAKEWDRQGNLYSDFNYKKGREHGAQRMWNEDGSIRANFVVIEGKRYGNIGSKNCKSVSENP